MTNKQVLLLVAEAEKVIVETEDNLSETSGDEDDNNRMVRLKLYLARGITMVTTPDCITLL